MSALESVTDSPKARRGQRRRFRNRRHAGRLLGQRLLELGDEDPVVLAIRGGGLPVAAEVAEALHAPLDVIVARKIRVHQHPAVVIGAAAETGIAVFDEEYMHSLQVQPDELDEALARVQAEIRRDVARYRVGRELDALVDRTAILVDDGVTSGMTARVALRVARALGADPIVLAAPVARAEVARALADEADEVVCLRTPTVLWAVGFWYENYDPVPEAAMIEALAGARDGISGGQPL